MKSKIDCTWKQDMAFEAEVDGFKIMLDTEEEHGGKNYGPKAKKLVLVALAGCTGMDVVSLLRKMRVDFQYFNVSVEGEQVEEHPKYFHKIHIIYEVKGKDIEREKVEKAVNLSTTRYCGVYKLLSFGAEITHEIRINA